MTVTNAHYFSLVSPPATLTFPLGLLAWTVILCETRWRDWKYHNSDVIMIAMASQITGVPFDCTNVRRWKKTSKLRVTGLWGWGWGWGGGGGGVGGVGGGGGVGGRQRWPVITPHNKGPVTRKMFPFDDVIMVARWRWSIASLFASEKLVMSIHITYLSCLPWKIEDRIEFKWIVLNANHMTSEGLLW